MTKTRFYFADPVVVEGDRVGVIVKSWQNERTKKYNHEVYVREFNAIVEYEEEKIQRLIYDKVLSSSDTSFNTA